MKKMIAILMALLMLLNCSAVFAEAAETETSIAYMNFTVEQYKNAFNVVTQQSGLNYVWADEALNTYGYPMYYATNAAQNIIVTVHDRDGVFVVETDVNLTPENINSQEFGTEMGAAVSATFLSAYLLQNQDATNEDIMNATYQIIQLITKLGYLGKEDAEIPYEMELGGNMRMQFSWENAEDGYMLHYAAYAIA